MFNDFERGRACKPGKGPKGGIDWIVRKPERHGAENRRDQDSRPMQNGEEGHHGGREGIGGGSPKGRGIFRR